MYKRLKITSFRLEELGLTHIKNYSMMLRRLTKNRDISALKILVDVLEPVKIYKRNQLRKQFSHSPLTRVVDAARPDQETARLFNRSVDHFLEGMKVSRELKKWLNLWKANDKKLQPVIGVSPVLHEVAPLSKDLAVCAEIGLKALESILADKKPSAEWVEETKKYLEETKKPRAQMELMIIPGIEKLLHKVSE